jgi:predicted Zn-dependent protease
MLVWKGTAMIMQASSAPSAERARLAAEGRDLIVKANRADHEAVEPLLAYYRSFAAMGETPSANAVDALQKVVEEVPAAPAPRLELANALVKEGQAEDARGVILPVAAGPYNSPERPPAEALLNRIAHSVSGSASTAPSADAPAAATDKKSRITP